MLKKTPKINSSISIAALDDFALKKRHRYGTVLINAETGAIVDILESRETSDVSDWLKCFPNIKFFTRDGAGFYANAIRKAHPEAVQIMDRFHILQHLTDCCKKYINRTVKTIEPIESENDIQDIPAFSTVYERIMAAKKLKEQGKSVAEISDALFVMPVTVRKYINMGMDTAKKYDKKTGFEKSEEKANAKEQTFLEVKRLYAEGCTKISICRKLGLTQKTVKKYIEMESLPQRAYNRQREREKIAPYIDKINELALQKLKPKQIFEKLKILGYTGSKAYLERVITEQRKLRFAPPKRKVQRKAIVSLLYKNLEDVKGLDEESLCAIIERYPKLSELYGFVRSFKTMMFSKHYEQLEDWISMAEKSDIPEIHSFITGIKQDLDAVRAAIRFPYSNGVAEGNVTLIKLIKRIMFGRASFDLLRAKVLLFQSI